MTEITYTVPDIHCDQCKQAIALEVGQVEGVESVLVDLDSKRVTVTLGAELDDDALRAAIEEAGYKAA